MIIPRTRPQPLVATDLGDMPPATARRISMVSWFRLRAGGWNQEVGTREFDLAGQDGGRQGDEGSGYAIAARQLAYDGFSSYDPED
jgi:hypothetical protein